ncbi:MAG: 4Fe-4S dicluster domain-containing protein [Brevinematia bacterium]
MPWFAGVKREEIKWYPTIDPAKCVKCGICMNCGKSVFDWTKNGAVVARPYSCVVGCTTCANLCLGNAISFPDLSELREFYKKNNIWSKVKKVLEEEKRLD